MLPLHLLDEDTVEALLTGRPVTPGLAPLAGAVGAIKAASRQPVRPSAELAQRMASGDFTGISPAPIPAPAGRRLRSWLSGVSPRVRVVTGAVVLFTGLTAATATGALPGPAQARMETLIETVTPISFQDEPEPDVVDIRDTEPDRGRTASTGPGESHTPADPGPPVTTPPGKPETPPGKPETPGNPDKPETPPPGRPETPGNPDRPETPRPEAPAPDNSGQGNNGNGNSGNGLGDGNGGAGNGNGNGNSADRPNGPDR
ncbi:hypothetical protein [Jiangella anatolica]|uniref:Uncharacterized protein n=1 Tax=Jiangella anatolica TaxID=2670374 RepID=A0A2W2C467_9ACTN|nr:hypothetical protein [Jiangella anatolica]PZF83049.1 hypothetical protein C1I92_14095 [Jiangella anatolica]